jgi:hypothetical protein
METNNLVNLTGSVQVEAVFDDGHKEQVEVCQIRVKDFQQAIESFQDEPRLVDLYCRKEDGWSQSLSLSSFDAIADAGKRINKGFFERRAARTTEMMDALMPGVRQRIVEKAVSGSINTSPGSPSKPA